MCLRQLKGLRVWWMEEISMKLNKCTSQPVQGICILFNLITIGWLPLFLYCTISTALVLVHLKVSYYMMEINLPHHYYYLKLTSSARAGSVCDLLLVCLI
jgi:hypothetical protein